MSVESDIRFLENRLDVISHWPASERKHAVAEGISRRLTAIAKSSLARPGVEHLMAASCRLLDEVFADLLNKPPACSGEAEGSAHVDLSEFGDSLADSERYPYLMSA